MKKYLLPLIAITVLFTGCSLNDTAETDGDVEIANSLKLDLSNQELKEIPADVFKNKKLEELDLSGNEIGGAIPAEINKLKNLKVLDLSDNIMTGVPAEVGQLEDLELLDLSNNGITGLPHEIGNLKKLKWLRLSGNPYSEQDLKIIRERLPGSTNIIIQ
ncbi:MAG: leucine-rich repeat domain-containing protein [Candidatus Magasanikbacteria bacterium]